MELKAIQQKFEAFLKERSWDSFRASQVFSHLIEELGEISRYISIQEGYKIVGIGHEPPDHKNLSSEFAQAFNLFLQLAIHFEVNLEESFLRELETMQKRFPAEEWKRALQDR